MRLPSGLDLSRWKAVSLAQKLVEQKGGSAHGVDDEAALCAVLAYVEEHPDHPAALWCQNTAKRQREAFRRDWNNLTQG